MAEMIKQSILMLGAAILIAGCSAKIDNVGSIVPVQVSEVSFTLPEIPFIDDVQTKVGFSLPTDNDLHLNWTASDTLGVYPESGAQIFYIISDIYNAVFDGGGWALKNEMDYWSYIPFIGNMYVDKTKMPVSFKGQTQNGSGAPQEAIRSYLVSKGEVSGSTMTFNYSSVNCYLRVRATLPAGNYKQMVLQVADPLFVETGTVDLTAATPEISGKTFSRSLSLKLDNFSQAGSGELVAFVTMAPVDLSGKQVSVFFVDDSGTVFRCLKTPSRAYAANKLYGLTCSSFEEVEGYSFGIEGWGNSGSYSGTAY